MKAILISIQPKWCALIANGEKTVEIRKNRPALSPPLKCYIYCTLPPRGELFTHGAIREYANELLRLQSGEIVYSYGMQLCCDPENRPYTKENFLCQKVIGEFVCDKITYLGNISTDRWELLQGSVHEELKRLVTEKACLTEQELLAYGGRYAWHISELKIYNRPKTLAAYHQCHKCEYVEGCRDGICRRPLHTPPQSWCYVEELEG